ncbi:CYTH domain-containing protein [Halomonas sp. GXIMD04776]|uniref:CYTH domain-containing protein n=1 Tax=Halomonas sp. GXIMD04776 TaxID=3415605 RepID=UPI003C8ABC6F
MAEEIELKLALGNVAASCLPRHELLIELPMKLEWLSNTYYDTAQGALETARIALRVRRTPEHRLQTLKTAGRGSGGLSSRGEWEWKIGDDGLDLIGLADLPPIQALDDAVLEALQPRFVTDFERCRWLLETEDATIEAALDQGEIRANGRSIAINELELELKRGQPGALWQLAKGLAERVPLRPSIASKAERGMALDKGHWPLQPPDESLRTRADHALRLLDIYRDTEERCFLEKARDTYHGLASDRQLSIAQQRHASALASALTHPDWLTTSFGRHSLGLQQTL